MLTEPMLHRLWPHVDEAKPGLIAAVVASAPTVFAKYGLTSPLTVAHAMAQFSEEFGADLPAHKIEFEENLNYTVEGLMKTWPKHFPSSMAAAPYAHDPEKLANYVYEPPIHKDLGNRPDTDDGWSYRGRGGPQVTGYDGYAALAQKTGLDLLGNPNLVNEPAHFLECAVGDFVNCGCLPFAQRDDLKGVTHHLNGGYNGIEVRERWLERWKIALSVQDVAEVAPAADGTVRYGDKGLLVRAVQATLIQRGYPIGGEPDGDFGDKTRAAVLAFQATEGLPTTGVVDQATQDALNHAPARPIDQDRASATAEDLRQAGSTTVAHADNVGTAAKVIVAAGTAASADSTGMLDRAREIVDQVTAVRGVANGAIDVVQWFGQHLWIAALAVGAAVWLYGRKIIAQRLADHRSGMHMGR